MQDTSLPVNKCINVVKHVNIKIRTVRKLWSSVYVVNAEVNNSEVYGYTQIVRGAGD